MATVKLIGADIIQRIRTSVTDGMGFIGGFMEQQGEKSADRIRARLNTPEGSGGLQSRTGRLSNTIDSRMTRGAMIQRLKVGTVHPNKAMKYAAVHEYGRQNVRSKRPNGWMTIPLDAAKDARGVPRFTAEEARRRFRTTFVRRVGSKQRPIIFGVRGRRKKGEGNAVPLFLLVESVNIKARPYVGPEKPILTTNIKEGAKKILRNILVSRLRKSR